MMTCRVTGGVDTHRDVHVAAAVDELGRELGTRAFASTQRGYAALLEWLRSFGELQRVGIEGTGSYGAGLQRALAAADVETVEVDRPDRKARRWQGKDDTVDAFAAARMTLAQIRTTIPKQRTGTVESLRVLRVARTSAVKARGDAQRQIQSLMTTAPDELRSQLRALSKPKLLARCAAMRPDRSSAADPSTAVRIALRDLARRERTLGTEIKQLDELIADLTQQANPALLEQPGVGPETAAELLQAVGDNPHRLRSEGAFAMLCGVAPLPASSGRTQRHRLNRNGNRQANRALHLIAVVRMRHHEPTRRYVAKRTADGLSNREIMRCLKRYIARDLYRLLVPN